MKSNNVLSSPQEMEAPVVVTMPQELLHADRCGLVSTAIHCSEVARISAVDCVRPSIVCEIVGIIHSVDVVDPGRAPTAGSQVHAAIGEQNMLLRLIERQNVTSGYQ